MKWKNILIALKAVPWCVYIGVFVKTGTFEVVIFITRFTFDFEATFCYYVTFIALIVATLVTKPAKRFFFSVYLKLRSSQLCAFEVIPFVAEVTRYAINIVLDTCAARWTWAWHRLLGKGGSKGDTVKIRLI